MPTLSVSRHVGGEFLQQERDEVEKEIKDAEAEFRAALAPRAQALAWRAEVLVGSLADYIAREARSADLIVTGVVQRVLMDPSRHVDVGGLVMQAGRPVMIVPTTMDKLKIGQIVLGWKDTAETRRAAFASLPLLKKATGVTVVEVGSDENLTEARYRLDDVAAWLKRHGVIADTLAVPPNADDATQLTAVARQRGADVIVAGAYGHTRLREWAFGGVTRDLLVRVDHCSFLSH